MKILVTGATGFLGGALVRRLAEAGDHEVTASGRRELRGAELVAAAPKVRFVRGALEDEDHMVGLCAGMDRVFHCGALSSPWGSKVSFENANVRGTQHVLEGCRRHAVPRLVYVSSPSVYPHEEAAGPVKEDAPIHGRPLNDYIATKRRAEKLVEDSELDVITLRPRALFGPRDETLFPRILRAGKNGRFPMIGAHDPWMDCSYVENVVDALLLASNAPATCAGRVYNITNGTPIRRSELFEMLFREVGLPFRPWVLGKPVALALASTLELGSRLLTGGRKEPVLTRYAVEVLSRSQVLDISAARRELGYEPRVSIPEGLRQFGAWWRERAGS